MALSEFTTSTTCVFDSNNTPDPSGYVVLWDNGNATNVTLSELSFTQDVSARTATVNEITTNIDNRDNYRGCYCMRAYTIASRFYQCSPSRSSAKSLVRSRFVLSFSFAPPLHLTHEELPRRYLKNFDMR